MFAFSSVHTINNVEATFDFVERIVRLVAFDNIASALLVSTVRYSYYLIKIRFQLTQRRAGLLAKAGRLVVILFFLPLFDFNQALSIAV